MTRWLDAVRLSTVLVLVAGVAATVMLSSTFVAPASAKDDQSLRAFMRKKLDASSRILEGLTTEEEFAIKEGAAALMEMSKAEMWNVIVDEDYREFNRDFRSSVRKLNEAAEKENFDNATLQWMDTVKSCIECHKYVRSQRVTTKK